jgi:L-ascorbate metabolism protein UlaG (beta-lactamase superfamily)
MSNIPPLSISYIRASTTLLQFDNVTILTDPWFSWRMRFLPALRPPGIPAADIPTPDIILCSHLHADHFDPPFIAAVAQPHTTLIGPVGMARLRPSGFRGRLLEMAPGQKQTEHSVALEATAMKHTFPGPDEVGFRIETGPYRIFFGGDAAYSDAFATIPQQGPIDIAILPVGGSLIWGRRTVMDAADSARAARDMKARFVVPTHPGGDWPALPPMSRHPGKLEDLGAHAGDTFDPVILQPGERAIFNFVHNSVTHSTAH